MGFHLTSSALPYFNEIIKLDKPNNSTEFGCRDLYTLNNLKKLGLNAYFSRCLTLTLERKDFSHNLNDNYNKRVYFVNLSQDIIDKLSKRFKHNYVYVNQKTGFGLHEEHAKIMYFTSKLLEEYIQNASMIITTALHCAAPCLALGIPVILVTDDKKEQSTRFSALKGLIKIVTVDELLNPSFNFDIRVQDISELKELLKANLRFCLEKSINAREIFSEKQITNIRSDIERFNIIS